MCFGRPRLLETVSPRATRSATRPRLALATSPALINALLDAGLAPSVCSKASNSGDATGWEARHGLANYESAGVLSAAVASLGRFGQPL